MSLSERLSAPPARHPRPCAVGRIIDRLSEEDCAALMAALADDRWQTATLLAELAKEGHRVGYSTVLRHRKAECPCPSQTD